MLVTDIEITDYRFCPKTARHLASVGVTLKNQFVTLFCQLDLPEGETGPSRAAAFVNDAMRQLRRMPEIRSGRNLLEFSEGLDTAPALKTA